MLGNYRAAAYIVASRMALSSTVSSLVAYKNNVFSYDDLYRSAEKKIIVSCSYELQVFRKCNYQSKHRDWQLTSNSI
jgi:hypothetical protein